MNQRRVGVIVHGSQEEKHGLLPVDTDTKLAAYVSLKAASKTGAILVGIINSASEFEYIKHGLHHHPSIVINDLKAIIENAVERLDIKNFVIVNGHGGNKLIFKHIPQLENILNVRIVINNKIVELEGAHAATNECSMAVAADLIESIELEGQDNLEKFPEVGFVGITDAHTNPRIKENAKKTVEDGVKVDIEYGKTLLNKVINDVVDTITAQQV
jgi:2-amino-5-formylamino-6-ribosylaminopyrimidin-4(3H)-one 5'-monophosphate deformylase